MVSSCDFVYYGTSKSTRKFDIGGCLGKKLIENLNVGHTVFMERYFEYYNKELFLPATANRIIHSVG